jgi:hypothetical protein
MRKSLSEILHHGDKEKLAQAWRETEAAKDFTPLPAGEYVAQILGGEYFASKAKGTPGYKLTFRVLEGEHEGRQFWLDVWLTPAATGITKHELAKLGVSELEQLDRPLPQGIRCKVKLVLHRDDDGKDYNRVRSFAVLGIDTPEADPFAPQDDSQSPPEAAGGAL